MTASGLEPVTNPGDESGLLFVCGPQAKNGSHVFFVFLFFFFVVEKNQKKKEVSCCLEIIRKHIFRCP